jgi:hypothetical protein
MSEELALVSRESVKKVFRNAQMGCPMDLIKHEESMEFRNHEKVSKLKTFFFVCAFLCLHGSMNHCDETISSVYTGKFHFKQCLNKTKTKC